MAKAYIGTSGWQYKEWRGGFYPEALPQRKWLAHEGKVFDAVEVNGTFYGGIKNETVQGWLEEVPSDFRFTFKMWRGISHYKKLEGAEASIRKFFLQFKGVPARNRGPVLVQLPANLTADAERLDAFLDDLKSITGSKRWKVAVEFRDPSWYDDEVRKVMDRQRAAVCLHDMEESAPIDEPWDASFIYMRRHGPGGDHGRGYTKKQIQADARRVRRWLDEGKTAYVYYNNDVHVHAPEDAQALKEKI